MTSTAFQSDFKSSLVEHTVYIVMSLLRVAASLFECCLASCLQRPGIYHAEKNYTDKAFVLISCLSHFCEVRYSNCHKIFVVIKTLTAKFSLLRHYGLQHYIQYSLTLLVSFHKREFLQSGWVWVARPVIYSIICK